MSQDYSLHATEISYRVHITESEDRNEFINDLKKAIVKHYADQGQADYQPGAIQIGWFIPNRSKANSTAPKDYKYCKLKCIKPEDFKALKEIRFIPHKGTVTRIMEKMSKDQHDKLFKTAEHNFIIQKVPEGWTHQNILDVFKPLEAKYGDIFACKVSYDFEWGGPRDVA